MDALQMLVDEVALEGLDGVTIPALWLRVENRIPKFPLNLDPASKQFLWQSLVCNPEIEFYELPEKRPPLVLVDRFKDIDPETGIQEIRRDMGSSEDIYPVHIVFDNKHGIKGSCRFFNERVNITSRIRSADLQPCCTLEDAFQRWDERLVLVASQRVRFRALIGWEGDPDLTLPDYSYCILERLGRSRWQGELQRDLHCKAFKTDARKLHYLRKVLDRNGLVTLQSHVIRLPSGSQQHSVLLLLKRFHIDRRSKYDILMERVSNVLAAKPDRMAIMNGLKEEVGVSEKTFKRMYQYMCTAGLAQTVTVPLQELNPQGGPCKTKKGTDVTVRCLKLLKEYRKKVEDDEDDNEEDDGVRKSAQSSGRFWERDMLTQAFEIIENRGTKGISQAEVRRHMNIGKLEARMICRLLERYELIKGFMEDEGRQRTTKYISRTHVGQSSLIQQFEKEKARSEELTTGSGCAARRAQPKGALSPGHSSAEEEEEGPGATGGRATRRRVLKVNTRSLFRKSRRHHAVQHSTPNKKLNIPALKRRRDNLDLAEATIGKEDIHATLDNSDISMEFSEQAANQSSSFHSVDNEGSVTVIEEVTMDQSKDLDVVPKKKSKSKSQERPHETYRLLKRKNLIIEAVRSLKLIENLYTLQKMIMDEEKQDGVVTKCCKKSILRLVRKLSQEGLLRLYRTTIIQDGVSKKVEFVVHPSILQDDPLVKSAIEQIRFRISSSYSAHRVKPGLAQTESAESGPARDGGDQEREGLPTPEELRKGEGSSGAAASKTDEKMGVSQLKNFQPTIIPGLGRSLGFQPKMLRLRLVHLFLWYLMYGHPLRDESQSPKPLAPEGRDEEPGHGSPASQGDPQSAAASQEAASQGVSEGKEAAKESECPSGTDGGAEKDQSSVDKTVYVDDLSWKRYIPPTPIHREFGYGWALTSDILLCLPLSIFIQIFQVSYKVDGLEDFLNDPIKQHYLVRFLPGKMKKQLLYKRKYIFSFYESMQRLCYMGLLQFGPSEKFQDKDQVFIYLKRKATIVDTTSCEPHYNLVRGNRPFERRFYTFNTLQDVKNFWFDMQCVCLNTPLGVVRWPRAKKSSAPEDQINTADPAMETKFSAEKQSSKDLSRMIELARGSREVTDEGLIPGDGQGAAGLDSSFFSHLKRNWIWTSYILNKTKSGSGTLDGRPTLRLKTFLRKHPLPLSFESSVVNRIVESRLLDVMKEDEVLIENQCSDTRNMRVRGGRNQKRKRLKKSTEKKGKKKTKEEKKDAQRRRQPRFHDEADRSALQRMTRQRVCWSAQEDGFLMLCRVASHVLNRKIKKPFVPWQVVRDLLHSQFEESLDKTSLSVGRRSRYIMKNSQTYLNFKICLAEVYQDKPLADEFVNRNNDYENPEVCAAEFKEFVEVLRQKFSSSAGTSGLKIPDTKEELFRRFSVYVIEDETEREIQQDILTSQEDIHAIVLNNLIQSTLALSNLQMKSCRSFQTFHLYIQYRDEVLCQAFLKCQQRGLVNRRRVSCRSGPKKSRALPFVPMSYQLSQSYYRCFTWRFPSSLCTESFQFLERLRSAGREDRANTFSFQDQEAADSEPGMVVFSLDALGGHCLASLSLFILGLLSVEVSIPEQIVVVDSTMVDNEVVKSMGKEMDEEDEDEAEECESKRKIEVKARQASHTNYLLMKGYCAPGIVSLRNLNPNDNIVVNSCQMKLKLRCTPAHSHFLPAAPSFLDEIVHGEACLPSSFTRLLTRSDDSNRLERFQSWCIDRCGYSPEDLQAVLDVCSAIEDSRFYGCDKLQLRRRFAGFEEKGDGRTRSLCQYLEDLISLEEIIEVGGNTVRLVAFKYLDPWVLHVNNSITPKDKAVSGDPSGARKRKLEEPCLEKGPPPGKVPHLESDSEVTVDTVHSEEQGQDQSLRTSSCDRADPSQSTEECNNAPQARGIDEESQNNKDHLGDTEMEEGSSVLDGAVSSSTDQMSASHEGAASKPNVGGGPTDDDDPCSTTSETVGDRGERGRVSFVSRPWRVVDGTLNRPVCKGMLEALLFHVMSRPGVPEGVLIEHYSGVLQPVVFLELLQGLEEMGCVRKRHIKREAHASLFSRQDFADQQEEQLQPGTASTVFYEPSVDCCLRLGRVFPSEPNWNKWVQ
uniref:Ral transcription factor IIIC subunit 1 n=1 Tax=Lepisosteus oculatus TaxID=7918 RepID=W5LY11_LEPOC|nr:PREDICTED: general transcription factor 3C polypeptide 1 isoform X2 [Lepisosteus oculatus]